MRQVVVGLGVVDQFVHAIELIVDFQNFFQGSKVNVWGVHALADEWLEIGWDESSWKFFSVD